MPVRTKQLYVGPTPGIATWTTIYTVTGGETTIVKEVCFFHLTGTSNSGFLRTLSGLGVEANLEAFTGLFPTYYVRPRWIVLQPGDALQLWGNVANVGTWVISGTELAGVAS